MPEDREYRDRIYCECPICEDTEVTLDLNAANGYKGNCAECGTVVSIAINVE